MSQACFSVSKLTPSIGGEIDGVDLTALSDHDLRDVRQALLDHLVIFFRNQKLTLQQQKEIGGIGIARQHLLTRGAIVAGLSSEAPLSPHLSATSLRGELSPPMAASQVCAIARSSFCQNYQFATHTSASLRSLEILDRTHLEWILSGVECARTITRSL